MATLLLVSEASGAVTIPAFELAEGQSVLTTSDYEETRKGRRSKDEQLVKNFHETWLRQLWKVEPDKRLTEQEEWLVWYPMRASSQDNRAAPRQYVDHPMSGVMARYHEADGQVVMQAVRPEGMQLSEEQRGVISQLAAGNTYFDTIIRLASMRDYEIGERVMLEPEAALALLDAPEASVELVSLGRMWEQDVAEFRLETRGPEKHPDCSYHVLVLARSGRPVHLGRQCRLETSQDDMDVFLFSSLTRGYSYPDLPISDFTPKPLPALQPNGDLLGMQFSDATGQLAMLTREHDAGTSWLTFWDLQQRKAVYTQKMNGQWLLEGDREDTMFVVDPARFVHGLALLDGAYEPFGGVASPDFETDRELRDAGIIGRYPVTLNAQNEVEVWNAGYGKLEFRQALGHSQPEVLATARDGRLLTGNTQGQFYLHRLELRDLCSGDIDAAYCESLDIRFEESDRVIEVALDIADRHTRGQDARIEWLRLHPEKPLLAYCTTHPAVCGLVDYEAGRHTALTSSNLDFLGSDGVVLDGGVYNFETGQHRPFEGFHAYFSGSAVSSRHGVVFNTQPNYQGRIVDKALHFRSLETGEVLGEISRRSHPVSSLAVPSPELLLYATNDGMWGGAAYLLNLADFRIQAVPMAFPVTALETRGDWVLARGSELSVALHVGGQYPPTTLDVRFADFALLDGILLYAREQEIVRLDLVTGKSETLHRFKSRVHEFEVLDETGEEVVAQLDRGQFALPHAGKLLELPFAGGVGQALHYDRHSDSFFVAGLQGYSAAYNPGIMVIQRFSRIGEPIGEMEPFWGRIESLGSSSTGQLWAGQEDGGIYIWDIRSGLLREQVAGHEASVRHVRQLDDEIMATAAYDGTIKLWRLDVANGTFSNSQQGILNAVFVEGDIGRRAPKLVATLVTQTDGDLIVSSPDGYYWSTPRALHESSLVDGNRTYDYVRFDHWLNRPDIVLGRLGKASPDTLELWNKLVDLRQERFSGRSATLPRGDGPALSLEGPATAVAAGAVDLQWRVENGRAAGKRLHLSVNQAPVFGTGGRVLESGSGALSVPLTPGVNRIKAWVTDEAGVQSRTRYLTYHVPKSDLKPDLYVLSVGVSDYREDRLDLGYAAKDARDMASLFRDSDVYGRVHEKILLDGEVTAEAVRGAREFLDRSQPGDHVVVFFAGHGFLDKDNDYYFGTTDIDPYAPAAAGLSYEDISRLVDGIPSRHKLMMLDTCHSGEVTGGEPAVSLPEGVTSRGVPLPAANRDNADIQLSFELLQKTFVDLRAATGATVVSAAGGREYALERSDIRNGVFTASVIKGLRNREADQDQDGRITLSELREYTYGSVAALTGGQQKPTTRSYNLDLDYAVF